MLVGRMLRELLNTMHVEVAGVPVNADSVHSVERLLQRLGGNSIGILSQRDSCTLYR